MHNVPAGLASGDHGLLERVAAAEALVGALHHVLNQPLAVIIGRAQLLLFNLDKGNLDAAEARTALDEIIKLARRVADTIRRARRFKDLVMQSYLDGVDIVDLERSLAAEEEDAEDTASNKA